MKIAILNGPNLNLLGSREQAIYGNTNFETFYAQLQQDFPTVEFTYFQSNVEGELINKLQACNDEIDGVVLNAAGYTHTSVALGDTIAAINTPVVEVHISNIFAREDYRHVSLIGKHCIGSISGFGLASYTLAVQSLITQE